MAEMLHGERERVIQMLRGLACGMGSRGKTLTRKQMMEAARQVLDDLERGRKT